ncbi:helix-turn-helix domain-containing protein [Streptomyces sp. NPDC005181]|uniref:AraC-like ligand-binding domain-containing protein n=1 Tax=Streptomyces sp. NPDC005181 TaxID=3156869 RepID=UPI0033B975F9
MDDIASTLAHSSVHPEYNARGTSNWRALLAQSLLAFSVESDEPRRFRGHLRNRKIADVEFIEMFTDRHTAHRGADEIERDERLDYVLCLQVAGVGEFHQGTRTAVLQPGDITIFDATRPATVVSSADYQNVCIKFPQQLIRLPRSQVNQLTAARIAARDGLAPATGAFLMKLSQVMEDLSSRTRYLAARNALDLVTTMFQGLLDVPGEDHEDDGTILLGQIQEYIDDHLAEPELAPSTIASAQYISLRHLHSVFQENGITVSSWIWMRRLEMCKHDLVQLSPEAMSVAAIGLRWGFKTASHFGRAFKDRYGLTPAEFRRAASAE